MSDKDEKREQPDVEGHAHLMDSHLIDGPEERESHAHLNDAEGDDTPDVEGHRHKSPARKHK
jgi:hypothetical protein